MNNHLIKVIFIYTFDCINFTLNMNINLLYNNLHFILKYMKKSRTEFFKEFPVLLQLI